MLGNFSFGDYFKQEAIELAWELSLEGFGFDPERIWITVFEGDEELGLGPDTEAIEIWRGAGRPRGADRRAAAQGELLAGGQLRARAGPARSSTSTAATRFGSRRRPARRRQRSLPRVLEPRLHRLRPARGRLADRAAGEEHRHRPRPRADGGDPAGGRVGLRHRPAAAAGRPRRRALGPALRTADDAAATRAMRIIADHTRGAVQLLGRRGRALQRAARLRAAPDHAPRDPPGPRCSASRRPTSAASPSARSR